MKLFSSTSTDYSILVRPAMLFHLLWASLLLSPSGLHAIEKCAIFKSPDTGSGSALPSSEVMQQENFDIAPARQSRAVRQDRIECIDGRHQVECSGKRYRVQDYNEFGIALQSTAPMDSSYKSVPFYLDETEIGIISLNRAWYAQSSDGNYINGFSIDGRPLDTDSIAATKVINQALRDHGQTHLRDSQIPADFRAQVLEIRDWFTKLEQQVNALEKSSNVMDPESRTKYEKTISRSVTDYLRKHLSPGYEQIERMVASYNDEQKKQAFEYFRSKLDIFYQSAYSERAFSKPRGYAGDFEMMTYAYKEEIRGATLFARCLEEYTIGEPAPQAVRNRAQYLKTKIQAAIEGRKGPIRILSVAAGPAREIQLLVEQRPDLLARGVEIHLLDQDEGALQYAQKTILKLAREKSVNINLKLHNLAIKNVLAAGLKNQTFDFIYTAGLFDYLSAPIARKAAMRLFQNLEGGGQLIIGNFSTRNTNKFAMDLVMDWFLIYRTPEDMARLFEDIGDGYKLEQEDLGINLFAVIHKGEKLEEQ